MFLLHIQIKFYFVWFKNVYNYFHNLDTCISKYCMVFVACIFTSLKQFKFSFFYWLLQDYENISHIYIYWNWLIITENKFHIVYVNNDKIGYLSSKKWKIFLIDSYVSYYCF